MKRPLALGIMCVALSLPACKGDEKKDDAKAADAKDGDDKASKDNKDEAGADADGGAAAADEGGGDEGGGLAGKVADAAAGGGGGGGGDLVKYIPDGAVVVVALDAKSVFGSSLFKDNRAMFEQGEAADVFKAAGDCNVGPETWKAALVAGEPDGEKRIMVAGQASGIGTKATIECLAKKVNEAKGNEEWKVSEDGGRVVVDIDGGDATGYSAGDDVLVIAGSEYAGPVKDRLDGKGTAATDGSLKEALAGADTSKHVYFAGQATPDMATGPTAGLKFYSGTVDFSSGLKIAASMNFGDDAKAKATAAMISEQFNSVKPMAAGFGVPQGIVDSIKIEAKGPAIEFALAASNEDLAKLSALAQKQMGGMGGMGGM